MQQFAGEREELLKCHQSFSEWLGWINHNIDSTAQKIIHQNTILDVIENVSILKDCYF